MYNLAGGTTFLKCNFNTNDCNFIFDTPSDLALYKFKLGYAALGVYGNFGEI